MALEKVKLLMMSSPAKCDTSPLGSPEIIKDFKFFFF